MPFHCGEKSSKLHMSLCQANGWEWRRLPKRVESRKSLSYRGEGPKLWFSANHWVCRNYLQCLLSWSDLKAMGVSRVPHFIGAGAAKFYLNLLHGEDLAPPSEPLQEVYSDPEEAPEMSENEQLRRASEMASMENPEEHDEQDEELLAAIAEALEADALQEFDDEGVEENDLPAAQIDEAMGHNCKKRKLQNCAGFQPATLSLSSILQVSDIIFICNCLYSLAVGGWLQRGCNEQAFIVQTTS